MGSQFVEAILFARYNQSNFKALYGRLPGSSTYTKDYIQIPASISGQLKSVLKVAADRVEVEYSWPGGEQRGHFSWSTDRYHLKWDTDNPPLPWKLGAVGTSPWISLPGDTSKRDELAANAQFDAIEKSDTKPWLLAIKLAGEGNKLHLRVYFENPPSNLQDRSLAVLPGRVRDEILALPASSGTGFIDMSGAIQAPLSKPRAAKLVSEIQQALKRDPNVLLIGPPGTGKTVALEDIRQLYRSAALPGTPQFNPDSWSGEWTAVSGEARSETLVFHPSYSYENFVAGLFPKSSPGNGVELQAKPGPLLCLAHWVGNTDRRALLILDEFNRGPAAAIFGDTLSLLDKDKRSGRGREGAHIQRPYPSEKMPLPVNYRANPLMEETISEEIRLPAGVHILAAMNSTDRSVAPLDAAMRRRFSVIRVGPDYEALAHHLMKNPEIHLSSALPDMSDISKWTNDTVSALGIRVLRSINNRIEFCLGEDFLLGHALLWGISSSDPLERLDELSAAIDAKVVSTLKMTFVDQDDALAAVLGVPEERQVNVGQDAPEGTLAYWRMAPMALSSISQKRLAIRRLQSMQAQQKLSALAALVES